MEGKVNGQGRKIDFGKIIAISNASLLPHGFLLAKMGNQENR